MVLVFDILILFKLKKIYSNDYENLDLRETYIMLIMQIFNGEKFPQNFCRSDFLTIVG